MPKSAPQNGQRKWGNILNMHLSQIMNPVTGGVNTSATDPTNLTAEDEGYTFINTTTGQIKRFKGTGDGSSAGDWEVAGGSASATVNTTAPTSPVAGQTWFNSATNETLIWNGTEWVSLSSGMDFAVSYEDAPNAELDAAYASLESYKKERLLINLVMLDTLW